MNTATDMNAPIAARVVWPWIINPKQDLLWLIGGALGAWGVMALLFWLKLDLISVWFVWVIFIDTPHFYGTYARTVLDREERRRCKRLLVYSTGMLAVGPAAVLLGGVLFRMGYS
jgi:hypothetical protein